MSIKEEVRVALAVDLGGTRLRVAVVDEEGHIVRRRAEDTLGHQGPQRVMECLIGHLKDMASFTAEGSLVGLGLAVASPLNMETGEMVNPPSLPASWDGFTPKPILEERLALEVVLGNDATLAALGEHRFGAGRGLRHLLYVTVSTGIGGGIIVDDKLYSGSRGFAGEIGHMIIDRNGPSCGCGSSGCLESLASGTAIARMARERISSERGTLLLEMAGGDSEGVDARMVAKPATSGDGLALEILNEVAYNLGLGIASLLNIFDPELVILGGGVSQQLELLMPGIVEAIGRRAMMQHKRLVPIVESQLGDNVGLLGAAALIFEQYQQSLTPGS